MATTSNSHVMKTTRRGRPFVKDTHDLFATLIVSLQLDNHRYMFKNYPNTFTVDEAAHNLSTLKFSQSTRSPDPNDATKIITTTTTTTFSMTRDMAKGICQYFMDARLIENAVDATGAQFKDRGLYRLTPKGLHILERFITKNGISADHLLKIFAVQPICMRLLHLERHTADDEILISRPVMEILFRRFAGKEPNVAPPQAKTGITMLPAAAKSSASISGSTLCEADRALGVTMWKHGVVAGMSNTTSTKAAPGEVQNWVFSAVTALEWLNDLTTIVGRDEASEIAAHFVRYGFIELVLDKLAKVLDSTKVTVVGGEKPTDEGEFRYHEKALYRITTEGMRVAGWTQPTDGSPRLLSRPSTYSLSTRTSEEGSPDPSGARAKPARLMRKPSSTDPLGSLSGSMEKLQVRDSYATKLRQILEEPNLRSLFREFLRSNFCEENLSFWLDVQDFKRRFNTTSSAVAPGADKGERKSGGQAVMERHQKDLIAMAFVIYNTYLAPTSECELNIDHNIRGELVAYMTKIVADVSSREGASAVIRGTLDPAMAAKTLHASQLQTMVKLYERIQGYIFRLMATDSVPKFCKTPKYMDQTQNLFDDIDEADDMQGLGHQGKVSGTDDTTDLKSPSKSYITISQAANEKHAALLQQYQQRQQPC